jgi:hypothetical protein
MTALTPLEAYDVIAHSAQLQTRLSAALAMLSKKQLLKREKEWLSGAVELLHASREGMPELIERSLRLAELTAVREEHAVELQGRWVDGLEKLLAGITFHAGSRAPLIETLFPKQKLPTLRRAKREVVATYEAEWEKRLVSGYVKRMLGQEAFAFALPVIEEVRAAFAPWKAAFSSEPLPEDQALAVRGELAAAAKKLEVPIRQAKLLAEAALTPVAGAFEDSSIGQKPRKHSAKPVAPPADEAGGEAEPQAAAPETADEATEPAGKPLPKAAAAKGKAGKGKAGAKKASEAATTAQAAAAAGTGMAAAKKAGETAPTAQAAGTAGTGKAAAKKASEAATTALGSAVKPGDEPVTTVSASAEASAPQATAAEPTAKAPRKPRAPKPPAATPVETA